MHNLTIALLLFPDSKFIAHMFKGKGAITRDFRNKLAIGSVAAMTLAILVPAFTTSAFALNNAQDDKNNPTNPGCGVGSTCQSEQASHIAERHCQRFYDGILGNGENLPAQCYPSP
jgi:hypothetical protein